MHGEQEANDENTSVSESEELFGPNGLLTRFTKAAKGLHEIAEQCRKITTEARLKERIRSLEAEIETAEQDALERASRVAYQICAETRHVSLGDRVSSAILALSGNEGENGAA